MALFLHILLEIILKNYFFSSRCFYIFTDISTNNIKIKTELPAVYINVFNNTLDSNLIFHHHGCQDIIIHHENSTDLFTQFEKLIRLGSERFNKRKYVIIFERNSSDFFSTAELNHVSNLLVLVPSKNYNVSDIRPFNESNFSEETYTLMTHQNGEKSPKILDIWFSANFSFLYKNNLFPNKLHDQNGKQLRIGTFTYEPYSVVDDDNQTFHGTETSLVLEFVKKYNLTPVFTIIDADLWGDIYDNWTGIGLLGSLVEDVVDIGYAALYTWEEYYTFLDYTKPLTRTGVTCLVPAPELATGWLTPVLPFDSELWIAVFITFCFSIFALSLLSYESQRELYSNFEKSVGTMVKAYLLQPVTSMETRLIRFFMALNFVYVLILCSTYSSGLSSVMTVPRYQKAIKTVEDLALSGLPWGAPTDAWLISIQNVDDEEYKTIKKHFVVKDEDDLIKASKLRNFGFSLERLPYGHYAIGPYVRRDVITDYRIMPNDIYWEQCIFMIRKNSVLLPLLDNLILRVFEAGLASYWENQVVSGHMDMSVQRAIKYNSYNVHEHTVEKLKWVHVEGVFGILLIGYVVSAVIFLIEIFTFCLKSSNLKISKELLFVN